MRKEQHGRRSLKARVTSVLTSAALILSALAFTPGTGVTADAAASVSGPRQAADGTVTWDKVKFGSYNQDVEFSKKQIKWRILDIDSEGNAFLLADEALDCKLYNEEGVEKKDSDGDTYTDYSCTWETCTLRDWLNGTDDYKNDDTAFINAAFNENERNEIKETTVTNEKNPLYNTEGGNNTKDKIYLLSIAEVSNASYGFDETFAKSSATRYAKATDYACMNGAYRSDSDGYAGNCCWWLRSPGSTYSAAYADSSGWGSDDGINVDSDDGAVRPALHVNLSSLSVSDAGTVTSDGTTTPGTSRSGKDNFNKPRVTGGVTTWDCVYFGNYKQKATTFTKQPIEWRVLSVNGDDAFLVADKALDCKPYNTSYSSVTWKTCTLRDWLNGTGDYVSDDTAFINAAFNENERNAIKETTVTNEKNPSYDTEGGNDTTDKIYLLSIAEVSNASYGFDETFAKSSATRYAKATDYARMNGAYRSNSDGYAGNCYWWLRSPGNDTYGAAYVHDYGWGSSNGSDVDDVNAAVRPALHVNLLSSSVTAVGTVTAQGESAAATDAKEQAAKVDSLISFIGTVTKDSKDKIEAARKAYDALSADAKGYVTKYSVLTAAESTLKQLEQSSGGNGNSGGNNSGNTGNTGNVSGQTPATTEAPAATDTSQTVTAPSKVTLSSAKNIKKKSLLIKWKKLKGVSGYEVQYALNKKFTKSKKSKTLTSASKVSFTVKKLKRGKTYYVRVRAYNKGTGGSKAYGKWSKVKKVKIKK